MKKLFVIQKYVIASSIAEALRIERKSKPDECWLDDDWKKAHKPELGNEQNNIGFKVQDTCQSRKSARKPKTS